MDLTMRRYQSEEDFWRVREFLREVFCLNGRRELCWQVYRWDYCRWHAYENCERLRPEDVVFLWEDADGRLAAVLNPEGKGEAHLQVHPYHLSPDLDEEMVIVAEECLAVPDPEGRRRLRVFCNAEDARRQEVLRGRGYAAGDGSEYQRFRPISDSLPEGPAPAGYAVRSLGGDEEIPARSWASWRGFHPEEPPERYRGWEWYLNVQRAPMYRRELDLVAVAPGGEFASFCTVWYDDVNRTGAFEPVATVPEHRRKGLATAVMAEGLRRLRRLGATMAYVGSYSAEAGATYASLGFTRYELSVPWERTWGPHAEP